MNHLTNKVKKFIKYFRLHHWFKNLLIFLPLFASRSFNFQSIEVYLLSFSLFCLCASSIYLLNDFFDIEDDKKDPEKKDRAFASGIINKYQLWALFLLANILVFFGSTYINFHFLFLIETYLLLNILYTLHVKKIKYLDLLFLSSFYYLRILSGVILIEDGRYPSIWFFVFIITTIFSLSVAKRLIGLIKIIDYGISNQRPYLESDLPTLKKLFVSFLIFSNIVLFVYFLESVDQYKYKYLAMLIPLMFSYFSYNFSTIIFGRNMPSDPIIGIIRNKKLLLSAISIILIYLMSF